MFYSIIQIGPEVINNTTNIISSTPSSSIEFGLLQSMVVIFAGSLIFLGLGIKFHFIKLSILGHDQRRRIDISNFINSITLVIFFGYIIMAIIFSLYTELIPQAKFAFVVSLVFLGCFVFKDILERA